MPRLGIKRPWTPAMKNAGRQAQENWGRQIGGEIACTAVQEVQASYSSSELTRDLQGLSLATD